MAAVSLRVGHGGVGRGDTADGSGSQRLNVFASRRAGGERVMGEAAEARVNAVTWVTGCGGASIAIVYDNKQQANAIQCGVI